MALIDDKISLGLDGVGGLGGVLLRHQHVVCNLLPILGILVVWQLNQVLQSLILFLSNLFVVLLEILTILHPSIHLQLFPGLQYLLQLHYIDQWNGHR